MQCPGGSTKQGSAPVYFQFDSTTVSNFLPFGSAIAFLAFLGLPIGPVDTATFCNTEPPDTVLSATDILSLGIPALAKFNGAYSRLANYIQQQAFSTYCVCSGSSSSAYVTRILSLGPNWFYRCAEIGAVSIITDASPHMRDGTAAAVAFGQPALVAGDTATSAGLGAASALGSSAAGHPGDTWNGAVNASMEFWAKLTTPGGLANAYNNYESSNPFVALRVTATGQVHLDIRDASGVRIISADSAGVFTGAAHMFDMVLDSAAHTLALYVDGHVVTTAAGLSGLVYSELAGFNHFLGWDVHDSTPGCPGNYGEWSSFPFALSATQISDNFAAAGGTQVYNPPVYTPPADGTPPSQAAAVCVTPQDVCNQLLITNDLLMGLSGQLTEFAKRTTPTFWTAGKVHTGLTGTGVLSVLDILGVNVLLTTVPSVWGSTYETPRRLIPSAGSLQAGISGEFTDNWQLHYENEILMFQSSWANQLRYNLRPGIRATIIELTPGA